MVEQPACYLSLLGYYFKIEATGCEPNVEIVCYLFRCAIGPVHTHISNGIVAVGIVKPVADVHVVGGLGLAHFSVPCVVGEWWTTWEMIPARCSSAVGFPHLVSNVALVIFSFCNTGPHARRAAHIASLLFLSVFCVLQCVTWSWLPEKESNFPDEQINSLLAHLAPVRDYFSINSLSCFIDPLLSLQMSFHLTLSIAYPSSISKRSFSRSLAACSGNLSCCSPSISITLFL